jgi:hypothetical protein
MVPQYTSEGRLLSAFWPSDPGQSHLIFGAGSTGRVTTSQIPKLCCTNALYRLSENLDAIALPSDPFPLALGSSVQKVCSVLCQARDTEQLIDYEILLGRRHGRLTDHEVTVYKAMGHAMEDMVAAHLEVSELRTQKQTKHMIRVHLALLSMRPPTPKSSKRPIADGTPHVFGPKKPFALC